MAPDPLEQPSPPAAALAAPSPPREFLEQASALGVEFEPGDVDRLGLFLAHLLEANKTTNLTAITNPDEAWTKHIFDALTLLPLIAALHEDRAADAGPVRVIDIGSGGGLPALPLAIVMPDVRFTLVDATGKKATYLRATAAALGLENVIVINGRAERLGQEKPHRDQYDAATARALGHLAVVAELTIPLVKMGGIVLAVKGGKADEEVAECAKGLALLGATHDQTVQTPTGRIVVLSKHKPTPGVYPRRDGEPKGKPLGVVKKDAK
ncbi:MAG: 16S rRNA (guanine(527)-N(7))-methyltransferase RsmG [Phycisphaerales bacterium]